MRWVVVLVLISLGALGAFWAPRPDGSRAARQVHLAPAIPYGAVTATDAEEEHRALSKPPLLRTHDRLRLTLKEIEAWPRDLPPRLVERALREALASTDAPLPRQQLIFLAPRLLPAERAGALLRELTDPSDAEDVTLALAFNGDAQAREAFARLAETPSPAAVRNIVDTLAEIERIEDMGNEDARDILRSYRALEVLWRRFYFRLVDDGVYVPSVSHEARSAELDRELLPRWLARYPGHPGSDDVALNLGEWLWRGEKAAYWLNRASVLPDQRRTSRALRGLLRLVESTEGREFVDKLLEDSDLPNRVLLEYVRVRRIAAEVGFSEALVAMESVARRLPHSTLALGWQYRAAAERPVVHTARLGNVHDRVAGDRSWNDRISPPREAMELSVPALAFQFRCWEEAAGMEAAGKRPSDRIRLAEFHLRNPEALYPVYARRSVDADSQMFHQRVHGWTRARDLLKGVAGAEAALLRCDAEAASHDYLDPEVILERWGTRYVVREFVEIASGYESCAAEYAGTEAARLAAERARAWHARIALAALE